MVMYRKYLKILMTTTIIITSLLIVGFTLNVNNSNVNLGLFSNASAQQQSGSNSIPNWVKNAAKWWSEGQTGDSDFLNAIQYLIDQNIIHVSKKSSLTTNQNDTLSQNLNALQTKYDTLEIKYNQLLQQLQNIPENQMSGTKKLTATISAVAVYPIIQSDGLFQNTSYNGTILKIAVSVQDGTGLVLANTAIPEGVDFQNSARIAVQVAHSITGVDMSNKDVIFSITTNNQNLHAVDGGSAGGAMTVLLTSVILEKPINNQVLMTGTISSDGTIGPIGGVLEKAQAAANYGARIFLVPSGQGVVEEQHCTQSTQGPFIYRSCSPQEISLSSIMESKYGMKVIEVENIHDVLKYFNSS